MTAFRFNNIKTPDFTTYTILVALLTFFILSNINVAISKSVGYLMLTILSSLAVWSRIKKANKEFGEIMFRENSIVFYFQNTMKNSFSVLKSDVSVLVTEDIIEFTDTKSGKKIETAYKSKLEKEHSWEELLKCLAIVSPDS